MRIALAECRVPSTEYFRGSTVPPVPPTRPCRIWPRFTLRVLLIFVTLVAVGLGYWTHRAREQGRIVKRIQDGGGMVCYERDGPDAPEPRSAVIEWLAKSLGRDYFESVVEADIQEREQVPDVVKLCRVTRLYISCDELDDQDVARLANCPYIEVLNLGVDGEYRLTKVTDRSLLVLSRLPRLRVLHIRGAGLSEQGISALAASPTLEVLTLGSCAPSVDASDFDAIKHHGRIQSFLAWRRAKSGPEETIARW